MDYITKQLNNKINYYSSDGGFSLDLANYFRVKLEYELFFLMAYFWDINYKKITPSQREHVLEQIPHPSIGSIISIIRVLDIDKLVFGNKKIQKAINSYPEFRNERIGHGYAFEDATVTSCNILKEIIVIIDETEGSPIKKEYDLILVDKFENGVYGGINYKSNGEYIRWNCPASVNNFEVDNLYSLDSSSNYIRLSPFIYATFDSEFFIYRDIQDRLLGKIRYNQLLKTGISSKEWNFFDWEIQNDGTRKKSSNGTVINIFSNNYKKYINLAIQKDVIDFVLNNKSFVCATIWGHGGVGKTATVQSVCEMLVNKDKKRFDYILFISAKDRYYDYSSGVIKQLTESVDSYHNLIKVVNNICGHGESEDDGLIINSKDKILLIIDDFETFSNSDQNKITKLTKSLDINYHKVIITTRANNIIGNEIQTNELDEDKTADFLIEVIRSETPNFNVNLVIEKLNKTDNKKLLHSVTGGRPLFIFQFALVLVQTGFDSVVKSEIRRSDQAIDFLYGRIYDYLSVDGKLLFVTMSQLVVEDDLTNLIEKLQYVVNMEHAAEKFNNAFQELIKLRLVQKLENNFFRIYSKEILQIMLNYFSKESSSTRGNVISRIKQVTIDKKLDNEQALLENANSARYSRSEEEVNSQYRQILNRASSPNKIKTQAILNLSDYYFNNRGQKELALKVLKEFEHLFEVEALVVRTHSNYFWAADKRNEAISKIKEFFSKKPKFGDDKSLQVELYSLLLTYQAIDSIQKKEDLKQQRRYGEVEASDYYEKNLALNEDFDRIIQDARKTLDLVKNQNLNKLSASARQNAFISLYQSTNVCIRRNKLEFAIEICNFGIGNAKQYLHKEFHKKLNYLENFKTDA